MYLTMSRIYLAIPILAFMTPNELLWNLAASFLFIVASITDYYDGYFARKFNAVSNMGKFMDPIADKILVTSILTMLIPSGKVDPYMVILITLRDTFIGGIRSVAAADGTVIAAKTAGKWKTGIQMAAIPAVIIWDLPIFSGITPTLGQIGYVCLWLSVILSITSGIDYYLAYLNGRKGAA